MEKLSKLTTNNSLKLSDFDLGGISRSKNWIGYFERRGNFSLEKVDSSISMFRSFLIEKSTILLL